MSKLAKWFSIIICQWLLSILIFVILAMSLWNLANYERSANWVQVDGKIISLKITNPDGSEVRTNWSGYGNLLCQYNYTFEGKTYFGNRIGTEKFVKDNATRVRRYGLLKAQLLKDSSVTIWINPTSPTESALFRETDFVGYCFGLGIGLFWFGMLLWNYKRNSKKRKFSK
jgi:hypothetical protein